VCSVRWIEKLQEVGIRRTGTPKTGFRYLLPDGGKPKRADLDRIRELKIPPAWTDVFVNPLPSAKLQAIGRDKAGRWQYRYHEDFMKRQASAKYRRLLRFAAALPRIRAAVDRDLRRRGLQRERVLASMVRILERCFMRPGSEEYARNNRSYGLATVRPRHVRLEGDKVVFDYRGKSGQRQIRELEDRRVAGIVRELLRTPGRDVFKFVDGEGEIVDVRRRHINEYIREIAGAPFTAKDFRTWAGTLLCASEIARGARESEPGRGVHKKVANAAVKAVAEKLGNTPAVARASYISPAVLDGFQRGRVLGCSLEPEGVVVVTARDGLHEVERELVSFLRASVARRSSGPKLRVIAGGGRAAAATQRPAGTAAKPVTRAARGPER
jgi:DNA topoisomerase I